MNCITANTKSGQTVIINTELVSEKIVNILIEALNNLGGGAGESVDVPNESGLQIISFRDDGKPKLSLEDDTTMWAHFADTRAIVCNIENCIKVPIATAMDNPDGFKDIGLIGVIWKSMLTTAFHDIYHSMSFHEDVEDELYNAMKLDTDEARAIIEREEEKADEFGKELLYLLAKKIDIEPDFGPLEEKVALAVEEAIMSVSLPKEITDDTELTSLQKWAIAQKTMAEKGAYYMLQAKEDDADPNDLLVCEFKRFLHLCSGDAADDEEWLTATIGNTATMNTEGTMENAAGQQVAPMDQNNMQMASPQEAMAEADQYILDDEYDINEMPAQNNLALGVMAGTNQPTPAQTVPPVSPAPVQQGAQPVPFVMPGTQQASQQAPATQPAVVAGQGAYQMPLDTATYQQSVRGLYMKLSNHVFQNCQFNPAYQPFFLASQNIHQPVGLSEHEATIVKTMTIMGEDGKRKLGQQVQGAVQGCFIDNAGNLPGYWITMSAADGTQIQRKLIPQNPHKINQQYGTLTKTAQEAMNGAQIMWIVDPDAQDKQFALRTYNGQLQSNQNGAWVNV